MAHIDIIYLQKWLYITIGKWGYGYSNGLDNRRCNLRICTQLENSQNSHRRRPGKSRYRGVFPRGDKWQAAIQHDGKQLYLGLFDTEVEAAKARDRKAVELAGEFAVLNFPKSTRAHPEGGNLKPERLADDLDE